jgi:F0F1-type ATP synthase assembly protein I
MIQSLFNSEDEKKEGEKVEEKNTESPKNKDLIEPQVAENALNQEVSALETNEPQPILEESVAPVETEKKISSENFENAEITNLEFKPEKTLDFEEEDIIKDIEFGDNFLELEKEVAKIEEEVRRESEEKSEQEFKAENTLTNENIDLPEKISEPANVEPKSTEQGIFTSAINKARQEKQTAEPLENLIFVPTADQDNSDVLPDENQGFILPNRIAPPTENADVTQTNQTPQTDYKPESKTEVLRKSGLAWSAGIAFFASVVFLLVIGWFADLLLGTSPWMAVGGIVLGSVIGFVQLFRLTSQILKNNE